ncbi:MAG: hypothetical protein NTV05_04115 [Acidobacteria bacterium]|nr:hypothetical protein [Acidobacteriota bacterium]
MLSTWMPRAARWRRIVTGLTLTLAALAVSVAHSNAQAAAASPQAAPAPAAQAVPAARVFTGDLGMMFNVIKPDKTEDFEKVIAKLKEALAKSDDPVHKAMAQGWRVYKNPEPIAGGNFLYVFVVDPVVKDADYTLSKILAKVFPAEVQELFKIYSASYAGGVTLQNYKLVADMK